MVYSVITPYIIPPEISGKKVANIGDGFILNSICRLLYHHECKYVFTSRKKISRSEINKINSTKALILAGANQLNDNFTILPEISINILNEIKVPIVPFGIGIHGIAKYNQAMSETTKNYLRLIHERIEYSSWRCPLTIEYLNNNLPELGGQFLLTGCPVMYDEKIISTAKFHNHAKNIVLTVTERHDFWDREVKTIDFIGQNYQSSRKFLSLHQDVMKIEDSYNGNQYKDTIKKLKIKFLKQYDHSPFSLREYARHKGFQIFNPKSVDECLNFYDLCDLHIGSRVHAHLYFLSQAKKSFLTYVDERCVGFSKLLQFPICDFNRMNDYMDYDFEIYRHHCIQYFQVMQKFVSYLKEKIL